MCGRYTQTHDTAHLIDRFHALPPSRPFPPRYNIAPGQDAPVVISSEGPTLELFRWGLIPSWSKDRTIGNRIINARAETLLQKPFFSRLAERQRCLVIADGFYEWTADLNGRGKVPVRIRLRSRRPFAFAGLWDGWRDPKGELIRTYTILTTQPNAFMTPIHHRMPLILDEKDEAPWLNPHTDAAQWQSLIVPYSSDALEAYPVSRMVNSPRNDLPACIDPVVP